MRQPFFLLLTLLPLLAHAQNDTPLVASGTYDNDVYKWTFSVGDLAIATFQSTGNYWSQGSVQPVVGTVSSPETELRDVSVVLYPNPTENVLTVFISAGSQIEDLDLDILDAAGRRVFVHSVPVRNLETTQLSLGKLAAGSYFLRLTDREGRRMIQTIQKL
jgi:hypothetical protein